MAVGGPFGVDSGPLTPDSLAGPPVISGGDVPVVDSDWVTDEARLLAEIRDDLKHIRRLLDEFEPTIRALMGPSASGPLSWAMRSRLRKGSDDGGT